MSEQRQSAADYYAEQNLPKRRDKPVSEQERQFGTTLGIQSELLHWLKEILAAQCERPGVHSERTLDSMGDSAYAGALRLLGKLGEVEILQRSDRCVIGRWKE